MFTVTKIWYILCWEPQSVQIHQTIISYFCELYETFWNFFTTTWWDTAVVIVIVKFEINLKIYVYIVIGQTRHLSEIYGGKLVYSMSNSLEHTINAKHFLTVYCGLLTKARNCLPKYFDNPYEVYASYKYLLISRNTLKHFTQSCLVTVLIKFWKCFI